MTTNHKQDSNVTDLRFAEESTLGVLPAAASQIWHPAEPNSYPDFGGQIKTKARNPINKTRQNRKGSVVDLDASGGYNSDLTTDNLPRLSQGFLFADAREKFDTQSLGSTAVTDISVANSTHKYSSAAFGSTGKKLLVNSLLSVSGSALAANNGLKVVSSLTADTDIVVTDTNVATETANSAIRIALCGYMFASATAAIDVSGSKPKLHRASGAVDFTTLGLIPGEWVYLGGDASGTYFAVTANNGFARVYSVTATDITFDKTTSAMGTDAGTGKTVHMYFGKLVKNEATSALIKRRSYQWERDLGQADTTDADHQGEYLVGAVPNQATITIKQADLASLDLSFVATDHTTVDQTVGLKSAAAVTAGSAANAPSLPADDAFNTTSDISRLRLSPVSATNSAPTALFAYVTEATIVINNNVSANKAVGVLGAFDMTAGQFDVSGKITAYFADVAAVESVRANADVTFDLAMVRDNKGLLIDIPLLGLGDGRLSVQQNQPITLPLDMNAAADPTFNHTLLLNFFTYLPDAAQA